jgi:hypothetical protein
MQILLFLNGYVTELACDGDVDKSGEIDLDDATQILFFLNGYVNEL